MILPGRGSGTVSVFPENSGERPPTRPSRVRDAALLVAGCVAFVDAKSITTAGGVRIDDLEYWLIGTIPLALLYAGSRAVDRFARPPRTSARRLIALWVIALMLFCLGKDFQFYNVVRDGLASGFNLGRGAADFGSMLLLAAVAGVMTLTGLVHSANNRLVAALLALAIVAATASMMHLLLLVWR
jgi:hypothetical protein